MIPTTQILNVQETEVEREDNLVMAIESFTAVNEKAFQIDKMDTVNKVVNPLTRLDLYYFLNRDVISVKRQVYDSIMLLGDMGGLFGLIFSICSTILGIANYQKSDNLIVSDLFKTTAQAPQF